MVRSAPSTGRPLRVDRWINPRGEAFRCVAWEGPPGCETLLLIQHGLGEHAGRYQSLAEVFPDLQVASFDSRGHGESVGQRGVCDGLDELAADLEAMIPVLLARSGARRILLFGHSMGAAVVGTYLTTRRPHAAIEGVILCAPPVRVNWTPILRVKALAARVLARVAPSFTLSSELPPSGISSDPAQVERYVRDPSNHDRINGGLGRSLLYDAPRVVDRAGRITLPVLIYHGVDDPIVPLEASRLLFEALGSRDKAFHPIAGARHEVHHEVPAVAAILFQLLRSWVEAHPPS